MKQTTRFLLLILLFSGLIFRCKTQDTSNLSRFLPQTVDGWSAQGKDSLFDPFTISQYIDRAGEVYSAFGFQSLLTRLYTKEGQPDIHADFFDMGSAKNAFGIFSFNPDGEDVGVGQGSTHKGGLLVFWKDRFFVSLYAESEIDEVKKTLVTLGREVASEIQREGEIPALVSRLPERDLMPRGTHYFFNHLILNHFSFFSGDNLLELGEDAPAVLGRYQQNDDVYSLLLVEYTDESKASTAEKNFMSRYMPEGYEPGLFEAEDGKWLGVQTSGNLLKIFWNVPSQAIAEEFLLKVK